MCGYQGDLQSFIDGYSAENVHDGFVMIDYIMGALIAGNVASLQALLMHFLPEPEGGSIGMDKIFELYSLEVILRHVIRFSLLQIFGLAEPGNHFRSWFFQRLNKVVASKSLAVPLDIPCYLLGLRLKPEVLPDGTKLSLQWDNFECSFLANSIGFRLSPLKLSPKIAGKRCRKVDLFVKAVEFDPSLASNWSNISICLAKDGVVEIGGTSFGKVDVALKAVELESENSTYWNNLGYQMGPHQVVQVAGVSYKRLDALRKALEHTSSGHTHFVWDSIGALMSDDEVFVPPTPAGNPRVAGHSENEQAEGHAPISMKKLDCLLKSLEVCPSYATPLFHLGQLCPKLSSGCIPLVDHPALQRAVRLSPGRGTLQRSLGLTGGSIEVLDESLCYRLALEKNYDGLISELINDEPHSIPRFLEVVGDYLDSSSMRKLVAAVEKQNEA